MPRLGLGLQLSRRLPRNKIGALIKCGALSITTPEIDKVGKQTRDAVRGQTLLGNGSTYVDFPDFIQASALWDVEFELDELPASTSFNTLLDFRFSGGAGYVQFDAYGNVQVSSGTTSISGLLYKIENIILDFSKIDLFRRYTGIYIFEHSLLSLKLTNKSTGITWELDIPGRDDTGVIKLVDKATGDFYVGQQQNSPAIPTEDNNEVSLADDNGMSIAIRNEVENYDFSDGIDGWAQANTTISEANQILELDYSGALIQSTLININEVLSVTKGDKIFGFAKYMGNSEMSYKQLRFNNAPSYPVFNTIYSPTDGVFDELYNIIEVENTSLTSRLEMVNVYPSAPPTNGLSKIEGDISKGGGVFALNLTEIDKAKGTNYASMTAEQINAIKYDLLAMQLYNNNDGTGLIPTGTIVPCGTNGLLACFDINGDRVKADSVGRIKLNRVKCDSDGTPNVNGLYTRWADTYGHILNSDTDLITVNADGTNKVMPFADLAPLTPTVNPQLFYKSSNGTIIFTEEGVTTGSDCYDKFIKYLGM